MTPAQEARARAAEVLGRPVPSHEDVAVTVLELCDRLEAAELELGRDGGS